jgi:polyisoprenoid-binding protein YceI
VGKFPKILFRSIQVEATKGHQGKMKGDLTIRGTKAPVTLDFEFSGPVKSPFSGKTCIGFSVSGKVNREEYGMTLNYAMEGGGVVIGKDVQIHIELEADLIDRKQEKRDTFRVYEISWK